MVQTDFIDIANEASELSHGYMAKNSKLVRSLDASYEGNYQHSTIRDSGRTHADGTISFRVTIEPDNNGVRIRRRLDQNSPRQKADVYVDGEFTGTWYNPDHNEFLRWSDSDFDIHPDFTSGKNALNVRLEVKRDQGEGEFNDFRYTVYCFESK